MKQITVLFLVLPVMGYAQKAAVVADEWAVANSKCAAFYSIVQSIVKPEARPEYEKKIENHLRYAKGLHSSSEAQPSRFERDVAQQHREFDSATTEDKKRGFIRNGFIGCNSVASHTPLVIKEHGLSMSDK